MRDKSPIDETVNGSLKARPGEGKDETDTDPEGPEASPLART